MQTPAPQTTIPQHVLDRLESEWRQMGTREEQEPRKTAPAPRDRNA